MVSPGGGWPFSGSLVCCVCSDHTYHLEMSPEVPVPLYRNTPWPSSPQSPATAQFPGPQLQSSRQRAGALTSLPYVTYGTHVFVRTQVAS